MEAKPLLQFFFSQFGLLVFPLCSLLVRFGSLLQQMSSVS